MKCVTIMSGESVVKLLTRSLLLLPLERMKFQKVAENSFRHSPKAFVTAVDSYSQLCSVRSSVVWVAHVVS